MCVVAHLLPRLPGDVVMARGLQALVPGPAWAEAVTNLVRMPSLLVLAALMFVVVWWLGSLRAALIAAVAFALVWVIGEPLKGLVQRARPSADLVRVSGAPHGFGFPSTFATLWSATWLPILVWAWRRRATAPGLVLAVVAILSLIVGAAARVTLGAHWPSDIAGAYLVSLAVWTVVDGAADAFASRIAGRSG
jgi:undecaprenyl-diphosphatase